ncbi:MAG TPA: hypothetical protein VGU22_00200 [Methylomirabilota bacterium]|jgi:hypothetical protein|nr:hypothetical protein [Methylomirabilota bacterium]
MVRAIAGSIGAGALVSPTAAQAQEVVTGTLERIVVVFEDGRVIHTTGNNVFLVETPARRLAVVRPEARVLAIAITVLGPSATTPDAAESRELEAP